jgi:glycosyltransferase involved in cell wall biosynthesis
LKNFLRQPRVEVVVTHGCWPHAVFAPVVKRAGCRLVNAVHGDLSQPTWLDRWAARTPPDVVIANSRFTAGPAAKLFHRSRVEVVRYVSRPAAEIHDALGVRREVRQSLGTPAEAVVVLQASRLERWKGAAVFINALTRLNEVPGWEAWFAGGAQQPAEAEFLRELEGAASDAGIRGRVKFLGQRSDVPRLMAAADVLCQPNTGPEPFGLVFIEALYAGLPVVTSGFGGAVEIVDETCGVLTPPGDAWAVAEGLRGLIADPTRRRTLGDAGPARARELCDPRRALNRIAAVIRGPA